MERTRLRDRILPDYTRGEELFNTVSHIVGGGLSVLMLAVAVIYSVVRGNLWSVVSSAVYGGSLVLLYSMSSIYHGLRHEGAKKVLQVLDHCTIYLLICGTYTPVLLCGIRPLEPGWGWGLFALVWGLGILAGIFTAIDLKKYSKFSMICYIGMGWSIVLAAPIAIKTVGITALLWILAGGIAYTLGAVIYALGDRRRYFHSVFHIFVIVGSILQFWGILRYIL